MSTPTTSEGEHQYDGLLAYEAVCLAWTVPGSEPERHARAKEQVRAAMPALARSLDRLTE